MSTLAERVSALQAGTGNLLPDLYSRLDLARCCLMLGLSQEHGRIKASGDELACLLEQVSETLAKLEDQIHGLMPGAET